MATKPTKHQQTIIRRQFFLKRTISSLNRKNRSGQFQTQNLWRRRRFCYLQTKGAGDAKFCEIWTRNYTSKAGQVWFHLNYQELRLNYRVCCCEINNKMSLSSTPKTL